MIMDDKNTPEWHAMQARSLIDQIGKIAASPPGISNDAAAICALTHAVLAVEGQMRRMVGVHE